MNLKKSFQKSLRIVLRSLGIFFLLIVLYGVILGVASNITLNKSFKEPSQNFVEIYLLTNGVHSEFVFPLKNEFKDWMTLVSPAHTLGKDTTAQFVGFGWGDKAFYIETPTWNEFKVTNALKTFFFFRASALHVNFYRSVHPDKQCKRVRISPQSYQQLVEFVSSSFVQEGGKAKQIPNAHYDTNDAFYDAKRRYSLFYTCNTWTNQGLKKAHLKACLWTVLDTPVLNNFP